jgi:exonuclease 3'-5' domain-containing protein 1
MDLNDLVESIMQKDNRNSARESRLGLDCEGVNLGPDGEVTLVQIVTPDSDIYLFDVLTCPEIAPILKPILESESILKVRKEVASRKATSNNKYSFTDNS